jgi:thiamine kinase-like enzyme
MWYNKVQVFTVQNAMSGIPMLSEVTRRNFRKSSERVLAWLAKFHGETGARQVVYQRYARGRIGGMKRTIGVYSKATRKIFSRGLDLALKEGGKAGEVEIPLSYIHGDFNPHNILVDSKKLAVFDWEESSIDLPFIDIFHYFTVSSFSVEFSRRDRKLSKEDRYQKYFLENIEEILSKIWDNYGVLTIDENLFVPTYTFYLAHMAANEIKRDPLINDFELWANMLRMFVTKMESWSRQ